MLRKLLSRRFFFKSLTASLIIGLLICPVLNQVEAAERLSKKSQTSESKEKVAPILVALGIGAAVGGAVQGVEYTVKTLVFGGGSSAWDWYEFAGQVSSGALFGMATAIMCFFPVPAIDAVFAIADPHGLTTGILAEKLGNILGNAYRDAVAGITWWQVSLGSIKNAVDVASVEDMMSDKVNELIDESGTNPVPPDSLETWADFQSEAIENRNMIISTNGMEFNSSYGYSWLMLNPGSSYLQGTFNLDAIPSGALLKLTHLSSYAEGVPGNGYSPVDIIINGNMVENNYDVAEAHGGSHSYETDVWQVKNFLHIGSNTLRIEFEDNPWAYTHYWIQSVAVSFGQEEALLSNASISPSYGSSATNFTFSVKYTSASNTPPTYVQVNIDGTNYSMTSSDNYYVDGAIFTRSQSGFSQGSHNYYFHASNGSQTARMPASGTYSFNVGPSASGVTVTATPDSIPLDGVTRSTITAYVTSGGNPLAEEPVEFVCWDQGTIYGYKDTTDANGIADCEFMGGNEGNALIEATTESGPSGSINVDVYADPSAYGVLVDLYLESQTVTYSECTIKASVFYLSDSTEITNADITFTCRGEDGNYYGLMQNSDYPTWENPKTVKTDGNFGKADVCLRVENSDLATIKVSSMGKTSIVTGYLQVNPPTPSTLTPFITFSSNTKPDVEWAPDGSKIAVGSKEYNDSAAKIYETNSWDLIRSLSNPGGGTIGVLAIKWSPTGDRIAVGWDNPVSSRPGLVVWNTSNWTVTMSAMQSNSYEAVFSLDWSPDGTRIATGEASTDEYVRVWNASTGSLIWTSPKAQDDIMAISWSKDGTKLASGEKHGGHIKVWNGSSYSPISSFYGWGAHFSSSWRAKNVYALDWSPTNNLLAEGPEKRGIHGPIAIFSSDGVRISTLLEHREDYDVRGVDWSSVTNKIVSCAGNIRIWDGLSYELEKVFGSGEYYDVCWSPDGNLIAAGKKNGTIEIYAPFDSIGPTISITYPSNQMEVMDSMITTMGKITDAHNVTEASVEVNTNTYSLSLDSLGNFSQPITLDSTVNNLFFRATDGCGNRDSALIIVNYIPDTLAPNMSVLILPLDSSWVGDTVVHFQWSTVAKNKSSDVRYILQIDTVDSFAPPIIIDTTQSTRDSFSFTENKYYWRVKAYDLAGNEGNFSNPFSFVVDTTFPVIDSTTVLEDTVDFWGPFEAKTKITDNAPFNNPIMFYRTSVDTEWVIDTMTSLGGGWFIDSIPELPHDSLVVDYYSTVEDLASNKSRDPVSGSYSFLVRPEVSVDELPEIPREFMLFSPTPNPSLKSVVVKYGLPEKTTVNLSLYDISGRVVKTLCSGTQEKGYYKVDIKDNKLSKGIYFIKFKAGKFKATKKLIILR